jgi:hypothetical protein
VVEHLLSMCEVLGLVLSTTHTHKVITLRFGIKGNRNLEFQFMLTNDKKAI